jgi:hypothetical protein
MRDYQTQLLQFMILRDLRAAADGKSSIVVIDSLGDLIRNIAQLTLFNPEDDFTMLLNQSVDSQV